jgi:hypothetical protein
VEVLKTYVIVPVTFGSVTCICRSAWWLPNISIHQSREPINYLPRYQHTRKYYDSYKSLHSIFHGHARRLSLKVCFL